VKVLVQCDDVVGAAMAGTGIRCWEISSQLAEEHEVTLTAPSGVDLESHAFSVVSRPRHAPPSYYRGYDAVLAPRVLPQLAEGKRRYGFRLIVDLYDPALLENLELNAARPMRERELAVERLRRDLLLALRTGDHFVCASEVQRDMWIGSLTAAGRITPAAYASDPSLRELVDVVPFGIADEACTRTGPGMRERFGIGDGDFVLLWGGGIWNWLDPLTVIESVAEVATTYPDTRLVFMGLERPNERIPEMAMSVKSKRLADELNLTGEHVFFNYGWVPYQERGNFLLDADAGVSTHGDHVETHFAFRTRNLDYLWAGLPIVSTSGDVFADLLQSSGAGIAVAPNDRGALRDAIVSLREPERRARMSQASRALAERYSWAQAVMPLRTMLGSATEPLRPGALKTSRETAVWFALAAYARLRKTREP
jgi:glycosyltransferase involved in cell wall biosynthesis